MLSSNKDNSQDPIGMLIIYVDTFTKKIISACEEGPGICAMMLTMFSLLLVIISMPLSLFCVVKVVQVCQIPFYEN